MGDGIIDELFYKVLKKHKNVTKTLSNTIKLSCPNCTDNLTGKVRGYICHDSAGWYFFCHNDSCSERINIVDFLDGENLNQVFLDGLIKKNDFIEEKKHKTDSIKLLLNSQIDRGVLDKYLNSRGLDNHDIFYLEDSKIVNKVFDVKYRGAWWGYILRNLKKKICGVQVRLYENNRIFLSEVSEKKSFYNRIYNKNNSVIVFEGMADSQCVGWDSLAVNGFSKLPMVNYLNLKKIIVCPDLYFYLSDDGRKKIKELIDKINKNIYVFIPKQNFFYKYLNYKKLDYNDVVKYHLKNGMGLEEIKRIFVNYINKHSFIRDIGKCML